MKYKLENAVERSVQSAFIHAIPFTAVTLHSTAHMFLLLCYLIQDASWQGAILYILNKHVTI
jgi:hypothetical protein